MFSERTSRRLQTIIEDAEHLSGFIENLDFDAFTTDYKTVLAVERLLQRITEAVIQIGAEDMSRIGPDIPVGRVRALGNRLRHEYDVIDRALVFAIARSDVPLLRAAAARALES